MIVLGLFRLIGTFVFVALLGGSAHSEEGRLYSEEVVVEHAEIIAPAPGNRRAIGYITIWNGTGNDLFVEEFESSWVSNIELYKTIRENGVVKLQQVTEPRIVPPRSEFVMTEGGFQLLMDIPDKLTTGGTIPVIIKFGNKGPTLVRAKILPSGAIPTKHHHGGVDG